MRLPKTEKPDPLGANGALATFRIAAELEPVTAAEQLRITADHLSDIERGAVQASTVLLADMARLYGVSPKAIATAYVRGREAAHARSKRR